jgi:hypothetical protein
MEKSVLDGAVEFVQVLIVTGDAKKDSDTPVRMRVVSADGREMIHHNWIGDSGVKVGGDWFGAGTTYYAGPMAPWTNDFDDWRAAHPGPLRLGDLQGAYLEVEIAGSDHWRFSATIRAKLVGVPEHLFLNSDLSLGYVASDGNRGNGPSRQIRFDLIHP